MKIRYRIAAWCRVIYSLLTTFGGVKSNIIGPEETLKELQKGRGVRVVGYLKQSRWTDSNGKNNSSISVVCEHIEFKPMLKKDVENVQNDVVNDIPFTTDEDGEDIINGISGSAHRIILPGIGQNRAVAGGFTCKHRIDHIGKLIEPLPGLGADRNHRHKRQITGRDIPI